MTQYKDKAKENKDNINAGLLTYPALMTADIILYDAAFVPVGDDQIQHLELTRTLARKFNNKFGATFVEPKPLLTKIPRLMSLNEPTKKMSKSLLQGCLFLNDSPNEIEHKIKTAVTDSGNEVKYDIENKPGISNLLNIYSDITNKSIPEIESSYSNKGYGQFKSDLVKIVVDALKPFRDIKINNKKIESIITSGSKKASKLANAKIKIVKKKLGLI